MKNTLFLSLVMLVCATAAQAQTLTITTPQVLPQAITSEPITPINLEATGGSGNYTWSSVNGTVAVVGIIAPGLSVTSGGQIIGTPTTPQASTGFTVRVTDNATAKTVTKTLSIVIISDKPKLSLAAMNAATAGANYTWPFTASEGKTPYTWSSNGTLPQGLTLNSTTGVLSGMVSESQSPGNFTLSITVTGNNTKSASGNFVLGINPVFVWVTAPTLASGKVATPYSANLTVSGGKGPRSFVTKAGSALPVGLTLNGTTGRLSGTPTTEGNYTFTITAKDSSTPVGTRDQTFTLVVESYGMSVSGPEMISGQRYNAVTPGTFSVTGGVAPYVWSTVPALPTTLTINATTGVISGNLTAAVANYTVAVKVKDKGNQTASQNCTIMIQATDPLVWVTESALASGKVATPYSVTMTVAGGKSPYNFVTKNGSTLPGGLTLNASTGVLSGKPTTAGNYSFTITAKDSLSPAGTKDQTFTLAVEAYGMSVSGPGTTSGQQYKAISPATYTVTGGVAPYVWSTVPALPAALTINATTGVISGNLTAALGNYTVAVSVRDNGNQTATQNCTITVQPVDPLAWVTESALSNGKVAAAYSASLVVSGGKDPYNFVTKNGSTLPSGLTLNATTGVLSGTPSTAGNYSFTITAKDSLPSPGTIDRTFTLVVEAYGMSVSGPGAITAQQYKAITPATFSVTGGVAPYVWSAVPALPAALTINASTGVISGNLTAAAGNYTVAVTVKDKGNQTATQNCTISILPIDPLVWVTGSVLPNGKVATSHSVNMTVSGGKPPYSFVTKNGSTLPVGLTLSAATGVLSGAPTTAGNYTFTITAKDTATPVGSVDQTFTLLVEAYGMEIVAPDPLDGTAYQAYDKTFTVTGGQSPFTWSATGLPTGLTINATTGKVSGTPTASGNFSTIVKVTDAKAQFVTKNGTIVIAAGELLTISSAANLGTTDISTAFTSTLQATGGKPGYTWSFVSKGNLPTSAALSAAGVFSANSSTALTANFSVKVVDALGANVTQNMTLTFRNTSTLAVATTALPAGRVNVDYSFQLAATGGTTPYEWALTNNSTLPAGLELSLTGWITGKPTTAGNTSLTFQVTDATGAKVPRQFTLIINPASGNVTASGKLFTDVTDSVNLPQHNIIAVEDFDNDGRDDLLATNASGAVVLLRSVGKFDFSDATATAGLTGVQPALVADFNNDGVSDILSVNAARNEAALYLNNGRGVFAKQALTGLLTGDLASYRQVSYADIDNDGDLDLLFSINATTGGGVVAVFNRANVSQTTTPLFSGKSYLVKTTWKNARFSVTDANGDNKADLVILQTNGAWPNDTHPNHPASLYLNTGTTAADYQNATGAKPLAGFTEKLNCGIASGNEMSAFTSLDIDNDGDLDLINGSSDWPTVSIPHIYINAGNGTYTQKDSPIVHGRFYHHGLTVFDADLDGDQDAVWTTLHNFSNIYPRMWQNGATYLKATANGTVDPAKAFFDATTEWGIDAKIAGSGNLFSAAYEADLDGDGDLDFIAQGSNGSGAEKYYKVYRNDSDLKQAKWLKVELVGSISPAQGTGARVEVELKDFEPKAISQPFARNIEITNPKFGEGYYGSLSGWNTTGSSHPGYVRSDTGTGPVMGIIFGNTGEAYASQIPVDKFEENATYTLSFDVKNWSGEYLPSLFEARLFAGSSQLTANKKTTPTINGNWQRWSLDYNVQSGNLLNGTQIKLQFFAKAAPSPSNRSGLFIDNISLTTTSNSTKVLATSTLAQYLGADTGAATKSSLTFGLAGKAQAAKVTVYWPSGLKSVLENVNANQVIQIYEIDELPLPRPTDEGDVIAWGASPNGETTIPADLKRVVQITAGDASSAALRGDGTVSIWGTNWAGQRNVPADLKDVVQVAAGNNHYLALTSTGKVFAWGWNTSNQTTVPATLRRAKFIAAGFNTSYAISGDGRIVAWGANDQGQATIPAGLTGVTKLAAGRGHVLALKSDGTVVAWGRNDMGQATVPAGLTGVIQIATGDYHSVALKSNGTVVAWGANWTAQATVPAGLANVVQISAEGDRSLALKADNSIVNWGFNPDNISPPPMPGSILGIAAGAKHGLALVRKIQLAIDGDLPSATENEALQEFGFTATGGSGSYAWSIIGTKPDWLTLNATTGKISGTSPTAGTYNFVVRATSGGRWAEIEVILEVQKANRTALWVATTGNNTTGDGTLAKPFATIQKAVDTARTGETIMVQPGNYNGTVAITGKRVNVFSQSGEAKTTITGVKGQTVIFLDSTAKDTVIDGFTITGGTGKPSPSSYGFDYYGGGIHCRTTAVVKNCIIRGNGAGTPGRDSCTFGGAIYSAGSATDILRVENCVFAENYAWASGGATLTEGSKIILDRVTVYKNESRNFFGYQGGVSIANGGKMDLMNSILWANGGDQIGAFANPYNRGTVANVTYSLSQGGVASGGIETFTAGTGNLGADPKLTNPNAGDYSLQAGSPAINAANPALNDPDNTRADMGYQAGRRSAAFDSDADGVNDYRETYDGTNPFDAKSFNPLSVGLVAHYPFEGNAKDESGYKNDGIANGGATLANDQFGRSNSAYIFDGVNDYMDIGNPVGNNPTDFTQSTWVKVLSKTNLQFDTLITKRHADSSDWTSLCIGSSLYPGSPLVVLDDANFNQIAKSPERIELNQWAFVCSVKRGSIYSVYVNGVLKDSFDNNRQLDGSSLNMHLMHHGAWNRYTHGALDNVRIYNRALSAAEVSQLYSKESSEPNMVLVQGGTLPAGSALANQTVSAFRIARFETTWAEWKQVRTWAAANGYDIGSVGQGSADNHPVRNVNWYDAVKWLNAKSQMDGLMPVYSVNGTTYKTGQSIPTPFATANGYRLPAEVEWEWAARGGVSSQGYTYSGSNDINAVAWYNSNSSGGSKAVGTKMPNELGIYDMSGNSYEWCWDQAPYSDRRIRGGAWDFISDDAAIAFRGSWNPENWEKKSSLGFRYVRNAIGDMVTVQGGTLPTGSGLAGQKVQAYQIARTEVTWDEWQTVRTWAVANGYTDLAGIGNGTAANHPVRNVSWYDVVKWSNAKSQMEGLTPVYIANGTAYKTGQSSPTLNPAANGYRLPAEAEWEWAARGGVNSQGFFYSGSNAVNAAWYGSNSAEGTKTVGTKGANELGIYDMSGNVWEWCEDVINSSDRRRRGGGWIGSAGLTVADRGYGSDPNDRFGDWGFRLARNIGAKISISGNLPGATLNQAYAGYTFGAVGATGDKVWSVSSGTVPPGMSFNATTATLSGTPTTAGSYTFVIRLESGGYWDEVEVILDVPVPNYADLVTVQGGKLPFGSTLANQTVTTFQIGRYETTWEEWQSVRSYAIANGYDLTGIGNGTASTHPVQQVSWYDVVKWCNAKSQKEGLAPVYTINGTIYKKGQVAPTESASANGYRLPSEKEWEWAARGGVASKGYTYSGSNDLNSVAWYSSNSGNGTKAVGTKSSNELGLFDMSGNIFELCFEVYPDGTNQNRRLRGGGWNWDAAVPAVTHRVQWAGAVWRVNHVGFRVAKSMDYSAMVTVQGGTLPAGSALANQTVTTFQIGRYETTWGEWKTIRTWAAANGYDIGSSGTGITDDQPAMSLNWYDVVKWCNAKSQIDGLMPVYSSNGTTYKTGQTIPAINPSANGYRLPYNLEWDWAARGGVLSQNYTYSGGNDLNAVAWYPGNLGSGPKKPQRVGTKAPNELGIYDMTGNMWEWCFDEDIPPFRVGRGGSFYEDATDYKINTTNRLYPNIAYLSAGFRYARNTVSDMVTVQGGTLPQSSQLAGQKLQAFQVGRTEVTWGEWQNVRTWAVANGYTDLTGVGNGTAGNHPARNVNWYDVVKWCNAKSQMEGLAPVYTTNGTAYKSGEQIPIVNAVANGYRLPVEAEWEWAARGGVNSRGYTYSGGNDINAVAWYESNTSNGTKAVATKLANELGIFDMSGNVWEWCWDLYDGNGGRRIRGVGWYGQPAVIASRGYFNYPVNRYNGDIGFRLFRNIGPKISITGNLPEATINQAYAGYTFGVVGGTGDKVWSISEGALPPGMSFSANGIFSGTPTTAGTFTFVLRVESGGYWDEVEVVFNVAAANYADLVTVQGGTLPVGSALANQTVTTFQIGKYETTWQEWQVVRTYAIANGYDLTGIGNGTASTHPVQQVSWYDVVKWCNAKSQKEGLTPVYTVNGTTYKTGQVAPTESVTANGYRLPSEKEWEWAARGGASSKGNLYAGSNDVKAVAWYVTNSSNRTSIVGSKQANELGIYDMSGNVMEWNSTTYDSVSKILRGGSFSFGTSDYCKVNYRYSGNTVFRGGNYIGFRVAKSMDYSAMVTVQGGTLPSGSGIAGQTVETFQIGKFEVTWGEWKTIRDWAVANGYTDLAGVGNTYPSGSADNFPVGNVSWYDVVKWCNAKSQKEGLTPVYTVNGTTYKTGRSNSAFNSSATGYRLPSEKEWEWAARGGVLSQGYIYSGSNDVNTVAWISGAGGTKAVGTKLANELGIHDMSGNVSEWYFNADGNFKDVDRGPNLPDGYFRLYRGGGVFGVAGTATVTHRWDFYQPSDTSPALGFRLARSLGNMVTVQGGTLPASSGLGNQTVATFQIGKYETTWEEWQSVRTYAIANGYDLTGIGNGTATTHPVQTVSWYDVVKWSNAKSQMEGMTPVYTVNGTTYKTGQSVPTVNSAANGYRLPSEKEWEWAARGGLSSGNFTYSGSNTASEVAWTYENSSGGNKAVGTKAANELGIYDMSGNVAEWCWDVVPTSYRRVLGGSWAVGGDNAAVAYRGFGNYPDRRGSGIGFRLARSSGN